VVSTRCELARASQDQSKFDLAPFRLSRLTGLGPHLVHFLGATGRRRATIWRVRRVILQLVMPESINRGQAVAWERQKGGPSQISAKRFSWTCRSNKRTTASGARARRCWHVERAPGSDEGMRLGHRRRRMQHSCGGVSRFPIDRAHPNTSLDVLCNRRAHTKAGEECVRATFTRHETLLNTPVVWMEAGIDDGAANTDHGRNFEIC